MHIGTVFDPPADGMRYTRNGGSVHLAINNVTGTDAHLVKYRDLCFLT